MRYLKDEVVGGFFAVEQRLYTEIGDVRECSARDGGRVGVCNQKIIENIL